MDERVQQVALGSEPRFQLQRHLGHASSRPDPFN
jgi:hypothetical protein